MKKLLFMAAALFALSSCDADVKVGDALVQNWQTYRVTSWEPVDLADGSFYRASIATDQITGWIYNYGTVNIYFYDEEGYQIPLPYTRHFGENIGTQNQYTWTRTIDFAYSEGWLDIFVSYSDFATEIPSAMRFRVVTTSY